MNKTQTPHPAGESLIPAEMKTKAIDALRLCLEAEKRFWDKESKDWVTEPDHATRLRAAELIMAYAEGRPIERKFELRGNIETFEERKAAMLESPEGIKTLRAVGAISEKEAAAAMVKLASSSTSVAP